jgi:hypothetical protein
MKHETGNRGIRCMTQGTKWKVNKKASEKGEGNEQAV